MSVGAPLDTHAPPPGVCKRYRAAIRQDRRTAHQGTDRREFLDADFCRSEEARTVQRALSIEAMPTSSKHLLVFLPQSGFYYAPSSPYICGFYSQYTINTPLPAERY